jgi:hypothetical protein
VRYVLCSWCEGSETVECGSFHPGGCEREECNGRCQVTCPRCTGEGMVVDDGWLARLWEFLCWLARGLAPTLRRGP